jgi:hypothetical protein
MPNPNFQTHYNRNLVGGKRPHRKYSKFGKYKTLGDRLVAEYKALANYRNRVSNQK